MVLIKSQKSFLFYVMVHILLMVQQTSILLHAVFSSSTVARMLDFAILLKSTDSGSQVPKKPAALHSYEALTARVATCR